MIRHVAALLLILAVAHPALAGADPADNSTIDTDKNGLSLVRLREQAIQAAVDHVAPSVVRIELVGGFEQVGRVSLGSGTTTGLIVDPEGFILSSAFAFRARPASILVQLHDGTRHAARLVATDHNRMLVLLKIDPLGAESTAVETDGSAPGIDAGNGTPAVEADADVREEPAADSATSPDGNATRAAMLVAAETPRIGQTVIAVGRTFTPDRPNLATGILSATSRIWGKAIQTDAAVSPNNYGGPLIDLRGRVLGLLVPLSPEANDELAGYQWYDSGIGFAIPAKALRRSFRRLMKGEDLHPGRLGIHIAGANPLLAEPVVSRVHPKSPAAEAGIEVGDRIVEIQRRPVRRGTDIKAALAQAYAGDRLNMVFVRGEQRLEQSVTLVRELPPNENR